MLVVLGWVELGPNFSTCSGWGQRADGLGWIRTHEQLWCDYNKINPPRQGNLWPGGAMVRALDLLGSIPVVPLSSNNLGQVVHMHVSLSPSSKFNASHGAVMPCGWEGNRGSCVTLAIRHRLHWFIIA